MSTNLKAIFFDAAGTLISVREPVGGTYARAAVKHGILVDPGAVMRGFRAAWKSLPQPQRGGVPSEDDERGWWLELVRRCFAHATEANVPDQTLADLFDEIYAHYERPEAWMVFPDVLPTLELLCKDHRLFVLSNFDKRLRRILAGHDLTRFFDDLIISSEIGASKPDSHIFATAAQRADARPEQCLHIGDDEQFDLRGASLAGFAARLLKRPEITLETVAREALIGGVL